MVILRVALTGSTGFTGQHVMARWRAKYDLVPIRSNILDFRAILEELHVIKPHVVLHLAGISRTDSSNIGLLYDTNVLGTLNLLSAYREVSLPKKKFAFTSSGLVDVVSDTSADSHYTASKLAAESCVSHFKNDFDCVILRPYNYTGVGQTERFIIPKLVGAFKRKEEKIHLGNVLSQREFNDVRWLSDVYEKVILQSKFNGTISIGTGRSFSVLDVASILEKISGFEVKLVVDPNYQRSADVPELKCDPTAVSKFAGSVAEISLAETLGWMYNDR